MSPTLFVVLLVGGNLLLVGTILFVAFSLVARATKRARAELEAEGVELDSGPVTIKTRYHHFHSPGVSASAMVGIKRGYLVLTSKRLIVLQRPQRYGNFERGTLSAFQVEVHEGRLHLHSSAPPGATGSVDYYLNVADPDKWLRTLTAAGMQRL